MPRSLTLTAFLCLIAVGSLVSCKDQAPPPPSVTGKWTGQADDWRFTFFLSQDGSAVSGNGTMTDNVESFALSIDGTFVGTTLSMTVEPEGFEPANYTGQLGDKVLVGTLNGSGFSNHAMTLLKAP